MKLLFLHGWGFDASFWNRVGCALEPLESVAWDRGYFGQPLELPLAGPVLAIGHSLGSLILAATPPPHCIGLIAINGFDRFADESVVANPLLERMRRRFAQAPKEVLNAFRVRCGSVPADRPIDQMRLADDLDLLASADERGTVRPLLVLHGSEDPILPAELRASVFEGAPREILDGAGHLLPLTHPDWCAARIRSVLP